MDYHSLSQEEFDAVVTGELTHFAIWLEGEVDKIISDHFVPSKKRVDFERLLLRREGLTFQDKIEIVRSMMPLLKPAEDAETLRLLLRKVEEFKSYRNAFAHGLDVTPKKVSEQVLHVEVVTRSGKGRVVIVTPDSHQKTISDAEDLLQKLGEIRKRLRT